MTLVWSFKRVVFTFAWMGLAWSSPAQTNVALASQGTSALDQIGLLVDIRHEIVQHYVEEPDQQKMVEFAVRGMIGATQDRYTTFLSPDQIEPFDKQVRGSFSGIGAEIDLHESHLRIVSPLEDSPSWKAGIMAGDIVLRIDGASTEGITLSDAIQQLTGPEGTEVTLLVRHESGEETPITITRARINVPTIKGLHRGADHHWDFMLDPTHRIGYIRVTQFTSQTAERTREALDQLLQDGVRGLILDVRFNPGGLLESAVEIADLFLKADQRIVSIKGRAVPEQIEWAKDDGSVFESIPMVVLANEASASAAEIVTGALADNQRAVFVGTRTFGKGSVQQVRMLENGQGALKITTAYYYLPNGRNIHRRPDAEVWGVDPEDGFYVPMTPEQVRKMVLTRRERGTLTTHEPPQTPEPTLPEWIATHLSDPQLAAGVQAILVKLETDQWVAVGQSGIEALVRQSERTQLLRQRDLMQVSLTRIDEALAKLDAKDATTSTEEPISAGDSSPTPTPDSPQSHDPATTQAPPQP